MSLGLSEKTLERGECSKFLVYRIVSAIFGTNGIGTPGIVRPRRQRIVASLAVRLSDPGKTGVEQATNALKSEFPVSGPENKVTA